MYKLVLASQSPRRKDLLTMSGFDFKALPVNISETPDKNLSLDEQILTIAKDKAMACLDQNPNLKHTQSLILSADTMVILDNVPYGKPKDETEAHQYLNMLSNRGHQVKTGIFLLNCQNFEHVRELTTTDVYFRKLSLEEINTYIQSGEPMDKAGAYGIQGLGGTFISRYVGPFDNVVGLSIESFLRLLKTKGWEIEKQSQ